MRVKGIEPLCAPGGQPGLLRSGSQTRRVYQFHHTRTECLAALSRDRTAEGTPAKVYPSAVRDLVWAAEAARDYLMTRPPLAD